MFKASLALLFTLRSFIASVESKGASITGRGTGLTVSHEGGGCPGFWYDKYGNKVCPPSIIHKKSADRQPASTAPAPTHSAKNKIQSGGMTSAKDQEKQRGTDPVSDRSNQPASATSIVPSAGQKHFESISGAADHRKNEKPHESLLNLEQPGSAGAEGDQLFKSEDHHRESKVYEGQKRRDTFTVQQLARDNDRDATRPPARKAISVAAHGSSAEASANGLDEQESNENRTERRDSGVHKGYAVILSAVLNSMRL